MFTCYTRFQIIIEGAKIPTLILIDQNIEEKGEVRKFITRFFGRYNEIASLSRIKLPYFNYAGKTIYFSNAEDAARQVKELMGSEKFEGEFKEAKVKFALIVGKEVYNDDDYYEELKRLLFKMEIISQNVLWENLTNRGLYRSVLDNLTLQIHSKLGIKYFALKYDTNYGSYAIVGDVAFLLPHTTDAGSVPVKIEEKVRIDGESVSREKIREADVELLYALTRMNCSTLFGKYLNIKLPAPVHYADKFVEAIRKDWELGRELLKKGMLYFI